MSLAPPSKKRPTWKAPTTVLPKANVSGSSSVACWLVELVNGSELTLVNATFPGAAAAGNRTPAATRVMTAPARTMPLVAILPTYASQPRLHRVVRARFRLLERVRPQEPQLFLVETGLHPAQHDVVDALLVAQLEERLAPPADECQREASVLRVALDDGVSLCAGGRLQLLRSGLTRHGVAVARRYRRRPELEGVAGA